MDKENEKSNISDQEIQNKIDIVNVFSVTVDLIYIGIKDSTSFIFSTISNIVD